MCVEIVSLIVVIKRQTNEVSDWYDISMLLNFSEDEVFPGKRSVLQEISFLIFLSAVWTSDIFSILTRKTSIFRRFSREGTFPIG